MVKIKKKCMTRKRIKENSLNHKSSKKRDLKKRKKVNPIKHNKL